MTYLPLLTFLKQSLPTSYAIRLDTHHHVYHFDQLQKNPNVVQNC